MTKWIPLCYNLSIGILLFEKGVLVMDGTTKYFLTNDEKKGYINALTPELISLRLKAGISQEEIANIIGTSRQTYGAIERQARKMSWDTYMSLIMFYDYNKKTHSALRRMKAFPHKLIKRFNGDEEPLDSLLQNLFQDDTKDILESLDDKARATIKTILMVEYSRCNDIPNDAVIKFFEGVNFMAEDTESTRIETAKAIKVLKKGKGK